MSAVARSNLPPGPPMGRLAGTVAFHRDPLGYLRAAQREYGDVFTIRLTTAGPVVVIAEPQAAAGLAELDSGAEGAAAHAGEARQRVLPMASALSVFGGDEQEHHDARARAGPLFGPDATAARAQRLQALVQRHIEGWPRGRPMRLLGRMRYLADSVFVHEVLGVENEPRAEQLVASIGRMLRTPGNPPLTIPARRDGLLGAMVHALYRRRRAPVASILIEELTRRRSDGDPGPGLLGQLLIEEPTRDAEQIVEELLSLLMAAQEPMASALTWLMLCVGGSEGVQERLSAGGEEDYERAVIEESLRLHPPALGMLRKLARPATLGGHALAAQTSAIAPIALLQRDPRSFAQPDRFFPERHLQGEAPAMSWGPIWPFGRGARRCIAEFLARAQLRAVLRALVGASTIRTLGPRPERAVCARRSSYRNAADSCCWDRSAPAVPNQNKTES